MCLIVRSLILLFQSLHFHFLWQWSNWFSDIVECDTNNGGCSQQCHNIIGSYWCTCNKGYNMESDSRTCTGNHIDKSSRLIITFIWLNAEIVKIIVPDFYLVFVKRKNIVRTANYFGLSVSQYLPCVWSCVLLFCCFYCIILTVRMWQLCHLFSDINECDINNGGCSQECHNNAGSYWCTCDKDYYMESDSRTCAGNHID